MSTSPEHAMVSEQLTVLVPESVADEVIQAATHRYYQHEPPAKRDEFRDSLHASLITARDDPQKPALIIAGLWRKGLMSRQTPEGRYIFVRYPHHGESGYGLSAANPEEAVAELISCGEQVLEDENNTKLFLDWFEATLSMHGNDSAQTDKLGGVALGGAEKI